jgi:hypothetical protein
VNFYDKRFQIGLTDRQQRDLVNFLQSPVVTCRFIREKCALPSGKRGWFAVRAPVTRIENWQLARRCNESEVRAEMQFTAYEFLLKRAFECSQRLTRHFFAYQLAKNCYYAQAVPSWKRFSEEDGPTPRSVRDTNQEGEQWLPSDDSASRTDCLTRRSY